MVASDGKLQCTDLAWSEFNKKPGGRRPQALAQLFTDAIGAQALSFSPCSLVRLALSS